MAAYSTSKPLNCGIRDEYEDAIPAMDSFQRYSQQYGFPLAIYADQHTTYQSPAEPTVAEQLAGEEPRSQFGRALDELGVELIAAHSPQAKGRVERLFKTVQDRLIKEMRLAGIATLEDSIHFLKHDLPHYNRRFAVAPAQPADLHGLGQRPRFWCGACVPRHPGVCERISPLHMKGDSIRCTTSSAPRMWWLKNIWMGRGAHTSGAGTQLPRDSTAVRAGGSGHDGVSVATPVPLLIS